MLGIGGRIDTPYRFDIPKTDLMAYPERNGFISKNQRAIPKINTDIKQLLAELCSEL